MNKRTKESLVDDLLIWVMFMILLLFIKGVYHVASGDLSIPSIIDVDGIGSALFGDN